MDRTTETHNKMMRPKAHGILDELIDDAQKCAATGNYAIRMHFRDGKLLGTDLASHREVDGLQVEITRDGKIKDGTK